MADIEDRNGADEDDDRPLYMIGVASELTGMHPQTLRTYEQRGLVTPKRTEGNTRLYSKSDLRKIDLVNRLTDEGINIAGVLRILDMRQQIADRDAEIDELNARVRELTDQVHEYRLRERIVALTKYDGSDPETVLRRLLPQTPPPDGA